jgi:8-oxo-dGTP diphosphatase
MMPAQQFPKLGASACVWKDDQVLLVQRAKPPASLWALPGGHVELGETTLAAAQRELLEETGITAELTALAGFYEIIGETPIRHYVIACYCGLWVSGEARPASDALAVRWVGPAELAEIELAPKVGEAIARARTVLKL